MFEITFKQHLHLQESVYFLAEPSITLLFLLYSCIIVVKQRINLNVMLAE